MTVYHDPLADDGTLDSLSIAVFGLGTMGLPLAAVLAENGASVVGVDIDETVVEAVRDGESPLANEPGVPELVARHAGGRLDATTDGAAAAAAADVSIVLVPTVLDDEENPDLSPVSAAGEAISEGLTEGDLVVLESTAPPGTTVGAFTRAVTPDDRALEPGEDFGVAHCPERTYAGRVIEDLTESYPKIVGGIDEASTAAAASLYRVFNEPGVIELDSATAAEAVKVFEGAYRDVNIALANELARACEEWGVDDDAVFEAANSQPFCDLHDPGIGVGGHCIPVYPHFIASVADETPLLERARAVNDSMPVHAVGLLAGALERRGRSLSGARVLVLGVTYRPGVPETRYAPAVDAIDDLRSSNVEVLVHDPLLTDDQLAATGAEPVDDPTNCVGLDGVVLATGHEAYGEMDLDALRAGMVTPVLVDGRDFFEDSQVAQFDYVAIGDGTTVARANAGSNRPADTTGVAPHADGGGPVT